MNDSKKTGSASKNGEPGRFPCPSPRQVLLFCYRFSTVHFNNIKENTPMAKKVTIDKDECIGCQSCVEICPDVFGFDEDEEKAYVLEDFDENADCAEEAQASCPADCITVE
jgi:ferredoxin